MKLKTYHESRAYQFLYVIHSGTFHEVVRDIVDNQLNAILLEDSAVKINSNKAF
jgi:hypothetical protein